MIRFLRPMLACGLAGAVTGLAGSQLVGQAAAPPEYSAGHPLAPGDIAKLKVLEPTLYHVEESYVEPERIDWEEMFVAGLQGVERRVPGFRFDRSVDVGRVNLSIGDYSTVLDVERVGSSRQLQGELRKIAGLIKVHLLPADVPFVPTHSTAFAEVEYALVNGILGTLDPHSVLLPPDDAEEMDVENQGEFGGLGVTIVEGEGGLLIENVLADTPAERAGFMREDVITRISGESTINMSLDEAVLLLRGPVGDPIELEIRHEGAELVEKHRLLRQRIKLNEVVGALLPGKIGVIRIPAFHRHVRDELILELAKMKKEAGGSLKGMILDLRDNPGGYLSQAVAVADTFLTVGEIVSTVDGNGRRMDVKRASPERTEDDYPMVVLLNANSASASEIVAGALRNNDRAVVVGERSFGKGSVQDLHQFYDTSKLKLTISQYLTPGDHSIQASGIPADVELIPVRLDERNDEDVTTRIFWRESVRREADLGHRLDRSIRSRQAAEQTAFSFRYLDRSKRGRTPPLDLTDSPIAFAQQFLEAVGRPGREATLKGAGSFVDTQARKADAELYTAFSKVGIDWTDGTTALDNVLPVTATLEVGTDGTIDAGVRETVSLTLTNTGTKPLYRVTGVVEAHDVLVGREFVVGKLDPGESRTRTTVVNLVDGYPSQSTPMDLSIRVGSESPWETLAVPVVVKGRALPDLAFDLTSKPAPFTPGEVVSLDVTVTNRGKGASAAAFIRAKNRSGPALDIVEGSLRPGVLRTTALAPCPEEDRKSGCQQRLLPGESWTGTLKVRLNTTLRDDYHLTLMVGDEEAYDHASIVAAGFEEHFDQAIEVRLPRGGTSPLKQVARAPEILLSRAPELVSTQRHVTVSGRATDDRGVRYVMIYAGGDKRFFRGEAPGVKSVPFTADIALAPGQNILTVIVEDHDGFVRTQSVVTEGPAEEVTASSSPKR